MDRCGGKGEEADVDEVEVDADAPDEEPNAPACASACMSEGCDCSHSDVEGNSAPCAPPPPPPPPPPPAAPSELPLLLLLLWGGTGCADDAGGMPLGAEEPEPEADAENVVDGYAGVDPGGGAPNG
jgi:hypothetical protein